MREHGEWWCAWRSTDDTVVLEISDDGKGFDSHAYFRRPPASAGLGLIGIRERVAHFGGVFRVTSRIGVGTRIYVSVPTDPIVVEPVAAAAVAHWPAT